MAGTFIGLLREIYKSTLGKLGVFRTPYGNSASNYLCEIIRLEISSFFSGTFFSSDFAPIGTRKFDNFRVPQKSRLRNADRVIKACHIFIYAHYARILCARVICARDIWHKTDLL